MLVREALRRNQTEQKGAVTKVDGRERRRHARFAITANVSFKSESNFFSGKTTNISEGGLYIECSEELPLGAPISIDLTFFGVKATVNGEVMWVASGTSGEDYGFGIQFVDLAPKTKRAIEKFMRFRAPVELDLYDSPPESPGPPPLPSKRRSPPPNHIPS